MNIVFEGINGSGKTTILNNLRKELEHANVNYYYISDLVYETPLKPVLDYMFKQSVFLQSNEIFKTSLYESLVLAANHHYIQEQMRNKKDIVLYDRDYISILAYQKEFIKNDYLNWQHFYQAFREIVMYDLKKIDMLIYVETPIEVNIRRTETRDKRILTKEDREYLERLKQNMEEEIEIISHDIPVIRLDGRMSITENTNRVKHKILELKR